MKIVTILLLLVFCQQIVLGQNNSAIKYFEGIIEYDIKGESYMQGVSDNELRERIGSTIKLYFKNGDYMREYLDNAGYTLKKMFYKKDNNMFYVYHNIESPDTLYFFSAQDTAYTNFEIKSGTAEKILDYNCQSSVVTANYVAPYLADTGTIRYTYFFCSELPVDPKWCKDMYIWSDIIETHKSIAVKFIEDDPIFFKQTFTATKIIWQPVDDNILKPNSKLVLSEMPKF